MAEIAEPRTVDTVSLTNEADGPLLRDLAFFGGSYGSLHPGFDVIVNGVSPGNLRVGVDFERSLNDNRRAVVRNGLDKVLTQNGYKHQRGSWNGAGGVAFYIKR